MKKIIIAAVCLFVAFVSNAQKSNVNKALSIAKDKDGNLSEAWTMIEQATTNDETKALPKTWYVRGVVLHAVANSVDPKYKSISNDPFYDAYKSLQKATVLDSIKKKFDDDLKDEYHNLLIDAFTKGRVLFQEKNFKGTLALFELVLEIEKLPYYFNMIDTSVLYNAGIAANNAEKYDVALKYLKQVYDLKYADENFYGQLSTAYLGMKDSTNALNVLKEGYNKYPNNDYILQSLLIYYVNAGEVIEGKKIIQKAKDKNPNNQLIYYAEAIMYEKLKDIEKAAESYEKCLTFNPNSYSYNFNEGALFYNQAVDIYKTSGSITDDTKYQEALKKAEDYLRRALPKMEKAHEIMKDNRTTVEVLKEIYYRLKMNDKFKEMKTLLDSMPK